MLSIVDISNQFKKSNGKVVKMIKISNNNMIIDIEDFSLETSINPDIFINLASSAYYACKMKKQSTVYLDGKNKIIFGDDYSITVSQDKYDDSKYKFDTTVRLFLKKLREDIDNVEDWSLVNRIPQKLYNDISSISELKVISLYNGKVCASEIKRVEDNFLNSIDIYLDNVDY